MLLSSSKLAVLRLQSTPAFGQPSSSAAFGGAAVSRLHPDCNSDLTQFEAITVLHMMQAFGQPRSQAAFGSGAFGVSFLH